MILYIDTTKNDIVEIALKQGSLILAGKKFKARYRQAEKLLPEIDKMLKIKKLKLSVIKIIQVANQGGSFTSLRIGVVTANALGYALGVPVVAEEVKGVAKGYKKSKKVVVDGKNIYMVKPKYEREPNITVRNF